MRIQYVQQSNCGCIRVYELCMYFGMEEALLLYVHTQYKGLCNWPLTFVFTMPYFWQAWCWGSLWMTLEFALCILKSTLHSMGIPRMRHGDSLYVSWGFPDYVMGRPSGCLLAGSVCKHARWLSRTEQVSWYFYPALRSCLHDLTVQYSPFSLFIHTYSTVTSGYACVAVCWRKTLSTTRGRQKHGSILDQSMPVLSPSSQPTGPPQPRTILPSANQHYSSTGGLCEWLRNSGVCIVHIESTLHSMWIPRCVMGDLARIVHHQNGRSKWKGVVPACALVGVPVLCATGCAPVYNHWLWQ